MEKFWKRLISIALAAAVLTAVLLSSACTSCGIIDAFNTIARGGYKMYFRDSRITMAKGEQRRYGFDDFMFEDFEDDQSAWSVTLSTSDASVVDVAGYGVYAVGTGKATVTATASTGEKATLTVTVEERIEDISLVFPFGAVMECGDDDRIDVRVVDSNGISSLENCSVEWTVNGIKQSFTGTTLTLFGSGMPEQFTIEVNVTDYVDGDRQSFYAKANACYYEGEFALPTVIADKTELSEGETAKFTLSGYATGDWYLDGELIANDSNICYVPWDKAGHRKLCVVTYGATVEKHLTFTGTPEITGLYIDVDSAYPVTEIGWDSLGDGFLYELTVINGSNEYSVQTTASSYLIQTDIKSDISVSVKSLSDGNKMTESIKKELTLPANADAIQYLERSWFGGNYYISTKREFYEFFDYMMYFRNLPSVGDSAKTVETVYMAIEGDVRELMEEAFAFSAATGSYNLNSSRYENIATLTLECLTSNVPTKSSTYDKNHHDLPLDMQKPHTSLLGGGRNYFAANTRGEVEVTSSEQLFRVAELGYKPVPSEGSKAEQLLSYATAVLDDITDRTMTDFELAHAIYDYILTKNMYDGSVVNCTLEQAVLRDAFYLDSILKDGDGLGVCDAMAKTYSLLCNMVGLKCVRVTGYAGDSYGRYGHAWNKVMIGGEWYVVDCTWGDASLTLKAAGFITETFYRESASHSYLFLTDTDIADSHVEDTAGYSKSSAVGKNVYGKMTATANKQSFDLYLQSTGAELERELDLIAKSLAENAADSWTVDMYGVSRESKFFGLEFMVCERSVEKAEQYLSNRSSNFYSILFNKGLTYSVTREGNVFFVVVSRSVTLSNQPLISSPSGILPPWLS